MSRSTSLCRVITVSALVLFALASCTTIGGEGETSGEPGPPSLPQPGEPILSATGTPPDYLVYRGIGLLPPADVQIIPVTDESSQALLRLEGEGVVSEIRVLPAREGANLAAFLADQSFEAPVVEGNYTGNDAIEWQLVSGRRRAEGGQESEAETHAVALADDIGAIHIVAVGDGAATAGLMEALLPTILIYPEDRNARWRDYTGFAAFSMGARWVGDVQGPASEGVLFQLAGRSGSGYAVWILDGAVADDEAALGEIIGSNDIALGPVVEPGANLGGAIDSRSGETRTLSASSGEGLSVLWRRPSGRPVSVLLLPVEAPSPLVEELIAFFEREVEPILFFGEAP